ncbi:nucleotidyltransferase domain-containing protein [Escherichia coli]|nr:nucleotidyltransferase domain-containing protein [Escherichia coli]
MGRFAESNFEVMNLSVITEAVCDIILEHCLYGVRVYLFGSALKSIDEANDIDILIVGYVPDVILLRMKINKLQLILPIHLMIISDMEELELDFIENVGGRLLSF